MKREPSPCPEPEVLAAFADGGLSGAELEMTVEHLRDCRDCRRTVGEAVRFEPLSHALREPKWRSRLPVWLATAAVLAGVGVVSVWKIRTSRANAPMRELVAATPNDARTIEARVSGGFPWAPLRATRGSEAPSPSQMKLVGVAGRVLDETAGDPATPARHAAAIARLLSGSAAEASTQLSALVQLRPEAAVWSDLAAALLTEAAQSDEGKPKLAQALAAADAALRLDSSHPEALFNRALVLEHLGVRDQARLAWKRYLSVDSTSAWAREAERHLRGLDGVAEFSLELERIYAALKKDPSTSVAGLVARFPQECRRWGESEILKRWAEAHLGNDSKDAAVHLRLARSLGQEIAQRSGEGLLKEAVATIERAGPDTRGILAEAHVQLREGQEQSSTRYADAERRYRAAATLFEKGGSPMALLALYLAAGMTFEQNHFDEAQAQLEQILVRCRPEFKANIAGIHWQLGLTHAAKIRWGRALESLNESMEGFQSLSEPNNVAAVREIVSEVYDRIGEPKMAWSHRFAALQELGRSQNRRLQVALYAFARGAAMSRDWPVGLSFVNLQLEMGRQPGDELIYTHALLLRASILGRMGQQRGAADDLTKASVVLPSIKDPKRRSRAEAEYLAVEGFLAPSPAQAIVALSRAIDFQGTKGRRMFMPELLLHRGRALEAIGQLDQAERDFESGIRELERQRVEIEAREDRWGMFGTVDELFDEAVLLALQKGDPAGAFAYSERSRARELVDSLGAAGRSPARPTLPNAIVLEYVQLPDRMIIFVVNRDRLRVVKQEVSRSILGQNIERLIAGAMNGDSEEYVREARVLYDRLLGPVADELALNDTLIIVPDGTLSMVPFAALIDPAGRYVIERRPVVVAPSMAVFSEGASRTQRFGRESRLLMVAGPAAREGGDLGTLTSERREIDSIASEYAGNIDYARAALIHDALQQRVPTASIIHFVGHAVLPDQDSGGALVISRTGQLEVRDIASMQLRGIGLVVLAACGTARGFGRAGEPSISVARAFLVAGVPSVVATLWPIEDGPAAEFFPRFHHYLVQGLPPAEALRAVQLEWIHRRDGSPGVWAAVQMIGT